VSWCYSLDMGADTELVTIFRSMDSSASDEANEISSLLENAGLDPVVQDDTAPDVPAGAFVVKVPEDQAVRADEILENAEELETEPGDPSHSMDLETIFSAMGALAEVEALGIRNVLDANGIPTVYVSPPQYPNLRFVVKVPQRYMSQAEQILADARAAGPEAAEEAEREGES
jgi:hypothetical protein